MGVFRAGVWGRYTAQSLWKCTALQISAAHSQPLLKTRASQVSAEYHNTLSFFVCCLSIMPHVWTKCSHLVFNLTKLFYLFILYFRKPYRHETQHCWILTLRAIAFVSKIQLMRGIATKWIAKHSYSGGTCVLKLPWLLLSGRGVDSLYKQATIINNTVSYNAYQYRCTRLCNLADFTISNRDLNCTLMACWSICNSSTSQLKWVALIQWLNVFYWRGKWTLVTCGLILLNTPLKLIPTVWYTFYYVIVHSLWFSLTLSKYSISMIITVITHIFHQFQQASK